MSLLALLLAGAAPCAVLANPSGGTVSAGSATIGSSGSTLTVKQTTDKAIIDWRGFDVANGETTTFEQPSAKSVTLNRVNSASASVIDGNLNANGNLVIVNQNGVVFGKNSVVNVNSLVATTADIDNENFIKGDYKFDKPGNPEASVINQGLITAKEAGLVGLVAPKVLNSGVITAKLGRIHLASGDTATVDLYGDGLMEVAASPKLQAQIVANTGYVSAEGGKIALTAAVARETVQSLIEVSGVLNANAVGTKNGEIWIYAEGSNAVKHNIAANKGIKTGSSTVTVSGTLDASSADGTGGAINVLGDNVTLGKTAILKANGKSGGGTISVGGEAHGTGLTPTSLKTTLEEGAFVQANAIDNGNGGSVVLWSDKETSFFGTVEAKGGTDGGNGGFIETSSHGMLLAFGSVNASAPMGSAGQWLLDPADITITAGTTTNNTTTTPYAATGSGSEVSAANIKANLDAGTNVTITTSNDGYAGNGDIVVSSPISTTGSGALTLSAYRDINIQSGIILNGGALTLRSNNSDVGAGAINIAANISTNGGNITIGGGSGVISAGSGYAVGDAQYSRGVYIGGSTVDAGTGNILINGQGGGSSATYIYGAYITGMLRTTSGAITVNGLGGSGTSIGNMGVYVGGTITSQTGTISLYGTGGEAASGTNFGIWICGGTVSSTGTGASASHIVLSGTGGSGGTTSNNGIGINVNGVISAIDGKIDVSGTGGSGNSAGINFYSAGGSILSTGASQIDITAIRAGTNSDLAIGATSGSTTIGGASASGSITINADTIGLGTTQNSVETSGSITIKPRTASTTIGINGGTGTLYLSSSLLGIFNPGTALIIGDAISGTGAVTINGWDLRGKTYDVNVYGGPITFASSGVFWDGAQNLLFSATGTDTADINIGQSFTYSGTGISNLTFKAGESVITSSANITASSGTLNVVEWANANNKGAGNIQLTSAQITSNGGDVTLAGGLDDGANGGTEGDGVPDNYAWGKNSSVIGVRISGGGIDTGSGNIQICGHGLNDAATSNQYGILLYNSGFIQTTTGDVTMTGAGGNGTSWNQGLYLAGSSTAVNTLTGSITLTGVAGNGTVANHNNGIEIDSAQINSTGVGGSVGAITITGTGGTSSRGVILDISSSQKISSVDGNIIITGINIGTGGYGFGTYNGSRIISSGAGAITISGIGSGGWSGVSFSNQTGYVDTIGYDGTHPYSGIITLISNTIGMNDGTVHVQTNNSIIIKPQTASTTIGINGGAGTLGITSTLLSSLHPGTALIIGDAAAGTGAVTINGWDLRGKTYDVSVYGGPISFVSSGVLWDYSNDLYFQANTGSISIGQAFTKSGGGESTLTFKAAGNITESAAINAASGSPLDLVYSAGGYIFETGSINTYGGNLVMRSNNADVAVPDTTYNAIGIQNATIQTGGGDIILGGGSASDENGNPTGEAVSAGLRGVFLNNGTMNAGGGDINILGRTSAVASGVYFTLQTMSTSGDGAIYARGTATASNGLAIGNSTISSANGGIGLSGSGSAFGVWFSTADTIYSGSGDINIAGSSTGTSAGINLYTGYTYKIYSSSGDITLAGAAGAGSDILQSGTQYIGTDGSGTVTSGKVTLNAIGVGNFTLSATTTLASKDTITINAIKNITISNAINGSAGDPVNVILSAGGYISDTASISTYGGDLVMRSNSADVATTSGTYSAIDIGSATLQTGGGDIILGGGSASDENGNPTGYANSSGRRGVYINNSTLNGGGGSVSILGSASTTYSSVKINNSTVITSDNGTLTIHGLQTGSNSVGLSIAGSTISTASGFINLSGTGNSATGGGLGFEGGNSNIYSVSGDITLTGTGTAGARGLWFTSGYTYKIYSTSGDITLIGNASGTADFIQDGTQYIGMNGSGTTTSGDVVIRATGLGGFALPASTTVAVAGEGNITIDAGAGAFINNKGANALTVGAGRWLVYSANPTGDTFGGLNSNSTAIWNAAYGDTISQTGNRYVFDYQPTLTISSTSDAKTYGNDATTQLAGDFAVTGYNAGVANAYLADSAATALSGAPSITSLGSGASANIGSYAITATQGSLLATSGYALTYVSVGSLAIQPRALTVVANNKTIYAGMPNVIYTGSNNLIDYDVPLVSWIFTPQGYAGLPGTYEITTSAGDPQNRLANYTITYISGTMTANALPSTVVTNMQLPLSIADTISSANVFDNSAFGADSDRDAYAPSVNQGAPLDSMNDMKTGRHIEIEISPALRKLLSFLPKVF